MSADSAIKTPASPLKLDPPGLHDWNVSDGFYFNSAAFSQVSRGVVAGIRLSPGLIVVTGPNGVGKTMLINKIVETLAIETLPPEVIPLRWAGRGAAFADLIEYAHAALASPAKPAAAPAADKASILIDLLRSYKKQTKTVALFIDDAQELGEDLLAQLFGYCQTPVNDGKLLQIVLFGSLKLEALLLTPSLRELCHDRVMLSLGPLQAQEAGEYIKQRLVRLDLTGKIIFKPEAVDQIARLSGGFPLRINELCGMAIAQGLPAGYGEITRQTLDALPMPDWFDEPAELLPSPAANVTENPAAPAIEVSAATAEAANRQSLNPPPVSATAQTPPTPAQRIAKPSNQERSMSRLDSLNKILRTLQSQSPGIEACALISEDGLMIASSLPQDLEETRVSGMTATLLNLGTRAATELRRGEVQEVIVRGEQGYAVMISAGRGALLLVLADETSKLGLIFFDMREAIKSVRTIL